MNPRYQHAIRSAARTLAVAVAVSGVGSCSDSSKATSGGPPDKSSHSRPALVKLAKARKGQLEDHWAFLGNVRALNRAELAAGAAGEIDSITVREGDRVSRGQILGTVDLAIASAGLKVAEASHALGREQHAQSQREFARLAKLQEMNPGSVAGLEIERAESAVSAQAATLASLEAQVLQAKAVYERHIIRAPFDGVVAMRHVDQGDWVDTGTQVADVVSTENVEVVVDGPAKLYGRIHEEDEVVIVSNGEVTGVVTGIVPALEQTTRTMRVRIRPAAGNTLLPGSAVSVQFAIDFSSDGLVVPQDALVKDGKSTRVVRVRDAKAELVEVNVLATSQGNALVSAPNLAVGDDLVTRGNERLRPGQAIEVVD